MKASRIQSRDVRRRQLLDVSMGLIAQNGYHATSVSDIIRAAGVARGTFYNYFDSKRQIFGELLDQLFFAINSVVFSIETGGELSVHAQVLGNIRALCTTLHDNADMTRLLLEQAVGLDEEAKDQLRGFYTRVLDRLQRAVEDGQQMGIVRDGDATIMAICLLGIIKESLYQEILGTRAPELDSLVAEIFEVSRRGILNHA